MARIALTRGQFAIVDESDAVDVRRFRWAAAPREASNGGFYVTRRRCFGEEGPETIYLHRFLLTATAGSVVDHINGNGLDNRRSNLRIADNTINNVNRPYANKTGFRGVHKNREGWIAEVKAYGRRERTCRLPTPEDAARAYDDLARRYHGDFARLNFPDAEPLFALSHCTLCGESPHGGWVAGPCGFAGCELNTPFHSAPHTPGAPHDHG